MGRPPKVKDDDRKEAANQARDDQRSDEAKASHEIEATESDSPSQAVMVGPMDRMGADIEAQNKMAQRDAKGRKGKTIRLKINPGPGNDMSDVTICHNYVCNLYKRNVVVDMDEHYFDVLKHAVVTTEVPSGDGGSTVVASIPQYSWSIEE